MSLLDLIDIARWTPRSGFPPSMSLGGRVFKCDDGLYLITNPKRGEGDPVRAVGWAESDYWARRAWEVPPFAGELDPPASQEVRVPSLESLGRPRALSFGSVRDFEAAQSGAKTVNLVDASYRLTDGAFLYCAIHGAGITYVFASNKPGLGDLPVAIEVKLPVAA